MAAKDYKIIAENITKQFYRITLFQDIAFTLSTGDSLAITGPNGSGKSTLLSIIAGIMSPTHGSMHYFKDSKEVERRNVFSCIGFESPLTNPYLDLTGYENITFAVNSKGNGNTDIEGLLKQFDLFGYRDKRVRLYSSGMKQRLRFLLAVYHDPPIILLDEPCTNLDNHGRDLVNCYLRSVNTEKIIVIATNDEDEAQFCKERIHLG